MSTAAQQELILPSNPADRKKILSVMQEVSASYSRIQGERDYVKEAITALSKDFSIPKRTLNKLSKVLHKGNFDEEAGQFEDFSDLYETLISTQQNSTVEVVEVVEE